MASSASRQAAATGAPLSAADIAAFRKFNSYPWIRDRNFLQGLNASVGKLTGSYDRERALGASLLARVWWYKSQFKMDVDLIAYQQYLAECPGAFDPDPALLDRVAEIQGRMNGILAEQEAKRKQLEEAGAPAWQIEAPTADLLRKADDGAPAGGAGPGEDAPYPEQFQAIIKAVTTGEEVPGIRDIPNNVVRVPGISPIGKMQAPPKPWERRHAQHQGSEPVHGDILDREFPDLEEDPLAQTDETADKRREDDWIMREG